MATQVFSQNGWPAYDNTSHYTRLTAAGQGWWCANADVAVVFGEFIRRFDAEIEEITQSTLDDWSYANRLVRGSTSVVSNHGSATAIDLNALKHPRGVRSTFSAAKAVKMRAIKNAITDNAGKPVLRLGMDYTTTVDDMHVEINATPARVKQAADKIRNKTKAPVAAPPKEPDVTTLDLTQEVTLSAAAAAAMSTASTVRKAGDKVSLSYILQWGGAGAYRTWKDLLVVKGQVATLVSQTGALNATVAALVQAIGKGSTLTAAQITQASQAGAKAALAELGPLFDAIDDAS